MEQARREKIYRVYITDSFYYLTNWIGIQGRTRYADILYPPPVDDRDPMTIAKENCAKMGIKVVPLGTL